MRKVGRAYALRRSQARAAVYNLTGVLFSLQLTGGTNNCSAGLWPVALQHSSRQIKALAKMVLRRLQLLLGIYPRRGRLLARDTVTTCRQAHSL